MNTRVFRHALQVLILYALCTAHSAACELMGISVNEEITAHHLFSAFRSRGGANPDGWGVAFYSDRSATLFKEATNAAASELAEFLETYERLRSSLLIAHIRKASVGGQARKNTHPFAREMNGKEYVLAHNGTLKGFRKKLELGRIKPLGSTDSEHLLCYLLGRIETQGITAWSSRTFEWLRNELRLANDTGSLNCLFSDGSYLFVYRDKNGYNSLYHVSRNAPYSEVHFTDLSQTVDLSDLYAESAKGVVVATRPLTDERWEQCTPGQLLVFKDGARIFPAAATPK